ncbi:4320_t:CDS:2, partial [Racocetra persica]
YYIKYGPNFELEVVSDHSSSDAATKVQEAINELNGDLNKSRMSGPLLFGLHLKQVQKGRPYIRPLKRFNKISISAKKSRARTFAKNIKENFNQIAKENYHPNDQVTLKELSYTVANTPFQIEFGSQNTIKKNKHELEIVQIIDRYQIPRDGYRALSAIQPELSRDHIISNQLFSEHHAFVPKKEIEL